MATEAQINANRQNAQKSTGPVSAEGKAAVSQNALKHGLCAVQDVVPTEDQAEFDATRQQMIGDLAPVGAIEMMLAQRISSLAWRLRRAQTMQAQVTEGMVESYISTKRWQLGRRTPKEPSEMPEYLAIGRSIKEDWCNQKLIERLFEYERRMEKSLYKTMAELRAMQKIRRAAEAETDSEKQSQLDVNPQKVIALVKDTWGEDLPDWVKGGLSRLGITEQDYEAASVGQEALARYRTQGNSGRKGPALSLASL
jgi:hypothetical protein